MIKALEKAMFTLKSYRPQVNNRPKAAKEVRIMLNVVEFGAEREVRKDFLQHLSVVLNLCV